VELGGATEVSDDAPAVVARRCNSPPAGLPAIATDTHIAPITKAQANVAGSQQHFFR
jgi:hypothetical protein